MKFSLSKLSLYLTLLYAPSRSNRTMRETCNESGLGRGQAAIQMCG